LKEFNDSQFPLVSVIVVSYNSEKYISQCLDSILKSNDPQIEILVVDNASTDNSLKIIEQFQKNITIIKNKKNQGFAEGNNVGIKHSSGEIILLINPDAYLTRNSITELIKPFLSDEQVMITGPKILYPNSKKIQSAGGILHDNGLTDHIGNGETDEGQYDESKEVDYVTGAVMAIRKKLFEKTGLFSESYKPAYFEELEKCVQAKKLNYKILFQPKSEAFHYESTTLKALSKPFLKHYHTNRFRFIYRNYSFKELFSKFIPSELCWFFSHCPPSERSLVIRSHLHALVDH